MHRERDEEKRERVNFNQLTKVAFVIFFSNKNEKKEKFLIQNNNNNNTVIDKQQQLIALIRIEKIY